MDLNEIKSKIRNDQYDFTLYAEIQRRADDLCFYQIEDAILTGEILEQYPDDGRGESCLMLGFCDNIPIHVVCGKRGERIVIITTYVPKPPKFLDPWTRSKKVETKRCISCGSFEYEERKTDYLYSYKGNYLLVPNTPVEVCLNCGMVYFDAKVLKEIERRFFAIQKKTEKPDSYVELPLAAYA